MIPRRLRRRVRTQQPIHFDPSAFLPVVPQFTESPDRLSRTTGHIVWASMLLGCTMGMAVTGLLLRFHGVFEGPGAMGAALPGTATAVALLALAVGVRTPQRLALWLSALAWRRFISRGTCSGAAGVLLSPTGVDRSLHWVVLSMIALAAGVLTALLPVGIQGGIAAYDWMGAHFLWSAASLTALQTVVVFAVALVPLAFQGLAASCAHHVGCPHALWEPRVTAWLLIGAAVGVGITCETVEIAARRDLVLVAASLPALLAVLVSVAASSTSGSRSRQDQISEPTALPELSDRWPMLIRAGVVTVFTGGVCTIAIWVGYFHDAGGDGGALIAGSLGALAAGILAGCRVRRRALRSIGGFGVTCALSGIILAASTVGLTDAVPGDLAGTLALLCTSLVAIGFAVAYGWRALLNRVASRSYAGAIVMTQVIVCSALSIWLIVPVAQRVMGRTAVVVMLALMLLALGGTLIIHEPRFSPRTRRARLLTVFGSIATMIVLAWLAPHWWQRRAMVSRSGSETAWIAQPDSSAAASSDQHH